MYKHLVIPGGGPSGLKALGALQYLEINKYWNIENIETSTHKIRYIFDNNTQFIEIHNQLSSNRQSNYNNIIISSVN